MQASSILYGLPVLLEACADYLWEPALEDEETHQLRETVIDYQRHFSSEIAKNRENLTIDKEDAALEILDLSSRMLREALALLLRCEEDALEIIWNNAGRHASDPRYHSFAAWIYDVRRFLLRDSFRLIRSHIQFFFDDKELLGEDISSCIEALESEPKNRRFLEDTAIQSIKTLLPIVWDIKQNRLMICDREEEVVEAFQGMETSIPDPMLPVEEWQRAGSWTPQSDPDFSATWEPDEEDADENADPWDSENNRAYAVTLLQDLIHLREDTAEYLEL